jgi:hypothetical protein
MSIDHRCHDVGDESRRSETHRLAVAHVRSPSRRRPWAAGRPEQQPLSLTRTTPGATACSRRSAGWPAGPPTTPPDRRTSGAKSRPGRSSCGIWRSTSRDDPQPGRHDGAPGWPPGGAALVPRRPPSGRPRRRRLRPTMGGMAFERITVDPAGGRPALHPEPTGPVSAVLGQLAADRAPRRSWRLPLPGWSAPTSWPPSNTRRRMRMGYPLGAHHPESAGRLAARHPG